jgi:L-amino acid N-acyltransferase YncA
MSNPHLITLEPAHPADLDFIIALESRSEHQQCIIPYDRATHVKNLSADHYEYLLIKRDEVPVGYLINRRDAGQKVLEIVRIVVADKGRGIGTYALKTLINTYLSLGFRKMWLDVFADNLPARAVYEKLGFVQTATGIHQGRTLHILEYQAQLGETA